MRHGFRALGVSASKMGGLPIAASLDFAKAAEAAGFGIVGVGEAASESFSLMGAMSVSTSTIELFSSIVTWTRTPVTTALAARTLDDLSGGRYRLALGTMPRPWSEGWHDIDAARPVERMRDFIEAIRAAWRAQPGSPVSHAGPYYRFRDYEPVFGSSTEAAVPIYLGITRPKMAELAGEVADGVVFNTIVSRSWSRDVLWSRIDESLERSGRTREAFDAGVIRFCAIDDDPAAAAAAARRSLGFYFRVPYFADILEHGGFTEERRQGYAAAARGDIEGMSAAISDELIDELVLCGTPAQVREKLRAYEGIVDWIQLVGTFVQPADFSLRQMERILETFAPEAGRP